MAKEFVLGMEALLIANATEQFGDDNTVIIVRSKKEGDEKMYLIVGLGNPEEEYAKTRHNMGFDAINKLSQKYNIDVNKKKFKGLYGTGLIEGKKVILLKPQTYMNSSGDSIIEVMDYYGIETHELIVIYDDMDIEKGIMKIRKKGGPGSHNGMKSVVENLQTTDFARIRIGIGRPEHSNDKINFVIGKIPEEEQKILETGVQKAAEAIPVIITDGIDNAMNKCN